MPKQLGVQCPRGNIEWSECHSCRLNPLRPCMWTADILQMIERHDKGSQPTRSAYTPSRMVGCDRQSVLMGEHDYYESLSGGWAAVRGTMIHSTLEAGGKIEGYYGTVREVRLSTKLQTDDGPVEISQDFNPGDNSTAPGQEMLTGKPDLILITDKVLPEFPGEPATYHVKLVDYKTSNIDHDLTSAKKEHMMQVNVYKWLIERELAGHLGENVNVVVDELEIIYLAYSKTRRFTSAGSLRDRGKMVDRKNKVYETLTLSAIPMLKAATIETWLKKRINQKKEAETTLPPILTGDRARWCNYCSIRDRCFEIERKANNE